jgi:TolA-binding protein/lipopolysaccharide biosynthesis regulator YciM
MSSDKSRKSTRKILVALLLIAASVGRAQETDQMTKLRLAQRFEQAGEWERAVVLYEELYGSEPANYVYLDGLQRSYTQVKEYGKAVKIIRAYLRVRPNDVNLMTTLGGLYYDSGDEQRADSIWKAVIDVNPQNAHLYRLVAGEMMEHRLYDECIRTYTAARSISKNKALFADELGNLYTALQQYASAAREYAQLVQTSPDQLLLAQSRMSVFTSKPDGLKAAAEVVHTEVEEAPDNIALHRLYAWILLEDRGYDLALDQYREIDKRTNADGKELFDFAQRLSREHEYRTAAEAFKEIVDQGKNPSLLPYARFGYARAIEELSEKSDTTDGVFDSRDQSPKPALASSYQKAVQLYEAIVAASPGSDLAMQSLFRIGMIRYEKLFDLDAALDALNRIQNIPQATQVFYDAVNAVGLIQEAQNDLPAARNTFEKLSLGPLKSYRDQATFRLAELDYFEAHFDSSLAELKRFDANPATDLANDALELQYFIQENNSTAPDALAEFAEAELLIRQRKYSESLTRFQDILRRFPAAMLVDDGYLKIGDLHLRMKQPNEALTAFRYVADSMQTSILQDRAEYLIGEVYWKFLGDKPAAIAAYEKLLAQHPRSLYAEEARKRIRTLRGDNS